MLTTTLKITMFMIIALLYGSKSFAQEDSYNPVAQVLPQPVGGMEAIYKHISYPELAKKSGVSGKVYVLAFINENGEVDYTKIVKGLGAGCDEVVENAVKSSKFNPGKNNGVPVKVKLLLSITFKL